MTTDDILIEDEENELDKVVDLSRYKRSRGRPRKDSYFPAPHANSDKDTLIYHKYNVKLIEKEFKGLSDSEKLKLTYTELVRRLSMESHRFYITNIDWDDPDTIKLRNAQMSNLKNLLVVTKMMRDLVDNLKTTEEAHNFITKEQSKEANDMIKKAQKLLQRKEK